jgi:hypothetical protein
MKKISALLLLVLCLSGLSVMSQNFYVGLGGTIMNTWVTNESNYGYPDMDYSTTFGGAGNVNAGFDFNKNIGLKLEVGFSKLGQNTKDKINEDTLYERKLKLNYLQIPLMFKYRTNGEVARFYVMAGPQFGFLLNAKQTYYLNDEPDQRFIPGTTEKISEETITSHYTSYDISARLDFGADITLIPSLVLNAGLTFSYGLMDINATGYRMPDHDGNYNASHNIFGGFNVGIAYVFGKGK